MPIRRNGNFDVGAGVLRLTRDKLAGFLSEEELDQTEMRLINGKLTFNAPDSVLKKITKHFGPPAG